MKKEKDERSFWEKLATLIVDKRNLFFLLYGAAMLFSIFASGWVSVNDDLTSYLPEETETRRGLDLMDEEFTTFATARVMVNNITYDQALTLSEDLEKIEGISEVEFDETEDHYRGAAALFDVTFDGEVDDDISLTALNELKEELAPYDLYVSTEVGNNRSDCQCTVAHIQNVYGNSCIAADIHCGSSTEYGNQLLLWRDFLYFQLCNGGAPIGSCH